MKSSLIAVSALLIGLSAPALANDNLSTINQIGTNSSAAVQQTGVDNTNTAFVKQGAGPLADNNHIDMLQEGTGNTNDSTVFQFGSDHIVNVHQDGDDNDNHSVLTQSGGGDFADVHQGGNDNMNDSRVQIQAGAANVLTIDQFGDNNDNKLFVSTFSNDGTIDVQQHGSNNMNDATIHSGIAPNLSVNSSVTVNQH